jgi:hypothetical protein
MSAPWMEATVALAVVTIGLSLVLFGLYRRVYAQAKSRFGLALLIFAAAFLGQSCLLVYSYLSMMPIVPESVAPFLFATGICEVTGLSAVAWTASR